MRGHINHRYREANNCDNKCYLGKFTKYLNTGSRGAEVVKVQTFLRDLGFYQGEIDGIYGQQTKEAVRKFQNEYADYILKP